MSLKIDQLIEGHLRRANSIPRDLYIPGLDDGGKLGENEIFDLDPDDAKVKVKDFQEPHAQGEGSIHGNASAL